MKVSLRGNCQCDRYDEPCGHPYTANFEGRSIGIRDGQCTIECQDLTNTLVVHLTFEELERIVKWCFPGFSIEYSKPDSAD